MTIHGSQVNLGALKLESVTKATSYLATEDDATIRMDATGGPRTVDLPPAADVTGHVLTIVKIDNTNNGVTIDPDGVEQINGDPTLTLTTQWETAQVHSTGTGWVAITSSSTAFDVDTILVHDRDGTGAKFFIKNSANNLSFEIGDFVVTDNAGNVVTQ